MELGGVSAAIVAPSLRWFKAPLMSLGFFVPLTGCLPSPQSFPEAMALTTGEATFPNCSRVLNLSLAARFDKPAIDMGSGVVAQVTEGYAESPMYRSIDVVHCETGVGLRLVEGGQYFDSTGEPVESPFDVTLYFSDDPVFLSPAELLVRQSARPYETFDLAVLASEAISSGVRTEIYPRHDDWQIVTEEERCACDLFYPEVEQRWFDASRIGPDYLEELGEPIESPALISERIEALRAMN
jgi:hypothetical protein